MKIMICYDGSDASKRAMEYAKSHAENLGGKVYLVRSMESGLEFAKKEFDNAERELADYAETFFKADGVDCEHHLLIRGLNPPEDLLQFAHEHEMDEIVIGIRRRSRVGKMLFGSTAQFVILEAGCPVITVK